MPAALRVLTNPRVGFWLLIVLFALAGVVLFFGAYKLRFFDTNIDGFSYIRIAEHYAMGRFPEAFNAYWSPMISWSIVPWIWLGIDSQLGFFLANASWSLLGVVVGTLFVWRRTGRNLFAALIMAGTLMALYAGYLLHMTPDLLVVTWTLMFAWALTEVNERMDSGTTRQRVLWGALLGAVCALGYFVKAFIVPVFVVVGIGWLAVRLVARARASAKGSRRASVKPLLWTPLGALVALVLAAAPFVTTISIKYGGPTIGSSFAVNFNESKFEAADAQAEAQPSLLLPGPPNRYAISFGEDRTAQIGLEDDRTGSSEAADDDGGGIVDRAKYYLTNRLISLPQYLSRIGGFAPFGMAIVVGFALLLAFGRLRVREHAPAIVAASVFTVYFLGYAAINGVGGGNIRYFWPLLALSTAVAALSWPHLWATAKQVGVPWRRILAVVLVVLIPVAAVSQLGFGRAYPFSGARSEAGVGYLLNDRGMPNRQVTALEMVADGVIEPGSQVVGSSGYAIPTLKYVFYMRDADVQLYGRDVPHDIDDPAFQQVLRDNGIDYYFLYEPADQPVHDVSAWGHVTKTYELNGTCADECRLSIVSVD